MADQAAGLLSPWLREKRIKMALPYIRGHVLDYGCGIGTLSVRCNPAFYLGIDIDKDSIKLARKRYPNYKFETMMHGGEKFDTIVALAVIEHIDAPKKLLLHFQNTLKHNGRIVLTTPHPFAHWIHALGATIGLFSKHAREEHKQLLDLRLMKKIAFETDLIVEKYSRFMCGLNQLFILRKK